jgi:hypothetical protein
MADPASAWTPVDETAAKWTPVDESAAQPGAASRLGTNLLSGAGVTSNEQAKQFFTHPIDVLKGMAQSQGELGIRAKKELENKDYVRGLTHAVEYLMPGLGPNLAQAGDQLESGDIAGGVGRTVGAAIPIVAGSPAGRGAVADIANHPAFQKALASVQQTVKPAVRTAARTASDIVDPELTGVISPRLAHAQKVLGRVANALEDKSQTAPAPAEAGASVERDATLDQRNIPEFAGEEKPPLVDMTDQLAEKIAGKPNFTAADRLKAKSLLRDALKSSTADVVDTAVPGQNAAVKAKIDFYLRKGDIASAEQALDQGAKAANPDYQPFFRDPRPVPTTNEIRARIQADANAPRAGTRADLMEDKAVDQQWQWHLERHGWSAESEARREFIARNSTGMTKGELAKRFAESRSGSGAQTARAQAAAPGTAADLTSVLQRSLDAVRKPKAQQ